MIHRCSSIHLRKLLSINPLPQPKSPFPATTPLPTKTPSNPNKTHHFFGANLRTLFKINNRQYSVETDREVDKINLKFAEAREEIESAMDSKETVYFDEEAECARAAVAEVLEMYQGLLRKLPEKERGGIQRAMGLKIEQLKAEFNQLNE